MYLKYQIGTNGIIMINEQDQRKQRIMKAAEQIFLKDGFHKSSLNELVAQLHISKSTIYEYFGSKNGLIAILAEQMSDQFDSRLQEISRDKSRKVEERMLEIAMFQGDIARGVQSKFIGELKLYQPEVWERYLERRAYRIKNHYEVLIQEGVDSGLFNPAYSKEFLLQLYLKMSDLISNTDIMEHLSISRREAYELIFSVYLKGTK